MNNDSSKAVKRPLNEELELTWRDLRYHTFYEVVDQLVYEIQEHVWRQTGKTKRRLRAVALEKLHYSVEYLVRDCVAVVFQRKRTSEAAIRKGQYYYSSNRPDKQLTYSIHIERAFQGLLEMGYLEVTKAGYFDRQGRKDGRPTSRISRYVASDKLMSLFTASDLEVLPAIIPPYLEPQLIKIRIKEKDAYGVERKISVPVSDTNQTIQMRKNLKLINAALTKSWYDLEIPDDQLTNLQKRLSNDPQNERLLRMDQRSLYRVFNDSNLETGGRFYGGWWQNIPGEYRRHLVVDGKQMVELDFSNQHPSILYAQEGVARPNDCYSGVLKRSQLPQGVTTKELREMVKAAFNAMLNSPKALVQAPAGVKLSKFGLRWAEVSNAIMDFHAPIAHHFYTGVGLRLQRIDSDIAEKVLLHFSKIGVAILPLHDSFLLHHGFEGRLEEIMEDAFKEIVGVLPVIKGKKPKTDSQTSQSKLGQKLPSPDKTSLDDLVAAMNGHDQRLNAFFSLKRQR